MVSTITTISNPDQNGDESGDQPQTSEEVMAELVANFQSPEAIAATQAALNEEQRVDVCATLIFDYLARGGRATRVDLRKMCDAHGFGTAVFKKALEDKLERYFNAIVKVPTGKPGETGFTLQEWAQHKRLEDIAIVAAGVSGKEKKTREMYADWYRVSGVFTLTCWSLSSQPHPDVTDNRVFLRHVRPDGDEVLTIPYGCFGGMTKRLFDLGWVPSVGNARNHLSWESAELPVSVIQNYDKPVPGPVGRGQGGKGVTHHEALPPGTEIPFVVYVPGSHIDRPVFRRLLEIAGKHCGLSPSSAHLGWGTFEPRVDVIEDVGL